MDGNIMTLLAIAELAEKWNISKRRVAIYCKEGRISDAVLKGRTWLICEDAEKPTDPRRVRNIGQKE